ncbi:MAG: hypothetical protein IJ960_01305 [Oscillospiraceae bacterium]|nr:hypothetical protein [Oscillospiraceae bacterium]
MKNELHIPMQEILREYPALPENYGEPDWTDPNASEVFLEKLWQWQQTLMDRKLFLQIRDCFCKAAAVLEDRDGTIVFRAAELTKSSGAPEQSLELYDQILPRVLRSGRHGIPALARGYYWAGAVRCFRALRSQEPEDDAMREGLCLFEQAAHLLEDCDSSNGPNKTSILWAMATGYAYLGEAERARQYCQEILESQKALPEHHPDRIETCIQFSQLCREYGNRAECQQWLLKAAALLEQAKPSENIGWMYGLVACNCRKLSDEKRLWLYQKEKECSVQRFLLNPQALRQWHRQIARVYAKLGDMARADYHRAEADRLGNLSQ